jgi:pyridoxine kinase
MNGSRKAGRISSGTSSEHGRRSHRDFEPRRTRFGRQPRDDLCAGTAGLRGLGRADGLARLLQDLIRDDRSKNVLGIVSGYLASPAQAEAVAELVKAVKTARPNAIYLCDPAIGDDDKLYVDQRIAEAIRDILLPLGDAATPNAFECRWLADAPSDQQSDFGALARSLPPPVVLVTSAPAMMRGHVGNLLVSDGETLLFEHPEIPGVAKGTGDLLAALFLAQRLQGGAWPEAAQRALASLFEIAARSAKAGADDLMLATSQDSLVAPRATINARRLR